MKRPLLPVVLLYVGGIVTADLVSLPLLPLLGVSFCLSVAALCWSRARTTLLYPLLFLVGLTNSNLRTAVLSPVDVRTIFGAEPHLVAIRGTLLETPTLRIYQNDEKPDWRTLARIEVTSLCLAKGTWQAAAGRVAVTTPGLLTNCFAGQPVEIFGVAAQPRPAVAEGTFDYRQYLKQQGIYYQLKAESESDWRFLDPSPAAPVADQFRAWARRALARGLPAEDESLRLEWALALGWKTALTEETSEPFVRAAT